MPSRFDIPETAEPRPFDCFVGPPSLVADLPPAPAGGERRNDEFATLATVRLIEEMTKQNLAVWERMMQFATARPGER